ncbi:YncE family protein [Streptomyces niveus]|uniref:YncE family protein n=1 Tax=Streptomyces niveus TaxID=193462 RepID=UPI00371DE113
MTPRNTHQIRHAKVLSRAAVLVVGAGLLVGLTGCQSDGGGQRPAAKPRPSSAPHGYVEGAEESSEQQSRLVLADAGTGTVGVLDLTTEDITPVDVTPSKRTGGVRGLRTDGRFAYLRTDDATYAVDSGTWTVDHGDHVHYYRAPIRPVGPVGGAGTAQVHSDQSVTAVSSNKGGAQLFDRKKLEEGTVPRGRSLSDAGAGAVVPYAEHLLVASAGAERDTVEVRSRDGAPVAVLDEPCASARGEAVTRRGVVFGCADGALLVSEDKGTFSATKIPYGRAVGAGERAADFRHRAGSTTLAARAGDDAVWVLDVADRTWTRIGTGPVVAANTPGEGGPLLVLGEDGALSAYDIATRKRTARTDLLNKGTASAVVEVDISRAYVNDAGGRKVYEIDYNDGLRLARSFPVGFAPTHMVETGR